jgi:hypothetical protein
MSESTHVISSDVMNPIKINAIVVVARETRSPIITLTVSNTCDDIAVRVSTCNP